MTDDNRRTKAQAVFFSVVMVLSMVGGSVAIAGGAAAASGLNIDDGAQTSQNGEITVSVSLDDMTDGTGEVTFALEDSDGDTSTVGTIVDNEGSDSDSADGEITTTIDLSNYGNIDAEEDATVYVNEGGTITVADGTYDASAIFEIDNTPPTASSPIDTDPNTVVSTTTPTITVEMTEEQTSINQSTIEVSASNGGNQLFELNEPEAQGITYSESDGNLTIDFSQSKLDALPDDTTIEIDVLAQDAAGNQLDSSPFEFSFDVNTNPVGVTIDNGQLSTAASGGGTTSTTAQSVEVDVTNGTAAIDTASVTVTGANGYEETLSKADGDASFDSSPTFSVTTDGSDGNFPELPDGDVTISASAEDADGANASDSFTFDVDTAAPVVADDGVTINNGNIVNNSNGGTVPISVTFNETVNANSVDGEINLDGDDTAEVTLGNDGDGADVSPSESGEAVQTVTYNVDLTSDGDGSIGSTETFENGSASVSFTAASDDTGDNANTNDSLTGSTSFEIDTADPSVTIDNDELPGSEPHTLQNVVDLSEAFSASDADGNEFELYIDRGQTGNFVPLSDVSEEPLSDFDTTTLPEGTHDLRINVSDAAGNTDESDVTVLVDNADASVSYDGDDPLTGTESGVEYNVADLVSVSDNGTDTISTYGFVENPDDPTYPDDFTTSADQSLTVDSNTNYVFGVELTDGTTRQTQEVSTSVLEASSLGITAERNTSDTGSVDVTVTSNSRISSLNVTASTNDGYVTQSSETLSDLAESGNSEEGFEYTTTYDADRDGEYQFTLANATTTSGLSIESPGESDTAEPDASAPALNTARLTNADADSMTVQLTFDEPISGATFDQSFQGESVTLADQSEADGDGVVNVTISDEVQTGGETPLSVTGVSEAFGAETGTTTDASADVTFELQFSEGINVVSIPAETGEIDLDAINQELQDAGVTNIQAYEPDADTEFPNYVPENSGNADFTELTGGEGYIVSTDQSSSIDVNVENVPDGESLERNSETLQNGWNLVGHFQEGTQPVDQAFATLPSGASYSVEQGYTGDQVSTLQPGEGYWTFTDTSGSVLIPVDYTGLNSDRPQVANVQMTPNSNDRQTGFSTDDTVDLSADVSDDDLIDTVQLNSPNLGLSDVTLTDDTDDGTYTATDVSVSFTEDVTAGETETLTVTAIDADGSIGVGNGQSLAVEEVSPSVSSATYKDTNQDGTVDRVDVQFDEQLSGTVDAEDFSVDGGSQDGDTSIGSSAIINGDTIEVAVTGPTGDTNPDFTLGYTNNGGSLTDFAGNAANDFSSQSISDGAAPVMVSASTADDGNDGTVDHVDVTLSEPISDSESTLDGTVFSTTDGTASLGDASTDEAGDDNSVDVVVNNAPEGDTSFTLSDLTLASDRLTDGSNSLSSSQTLSTVSDGADVQVLSATGDTSNDEVTLSLSEDITPTTEGVTEVSSDELSYDDGASDETTEDSDGSDTVGSVTDNDANIVISISGTTGLTSEDIDGDDQISIDTLLDSASGDGSSINSGTTVDITAPN